MDFLEKDLEQIIFETDNETLFKKGLCIDGVKKRQLRIGEYGIADVVTFIRANDFNGKHLIINVLELKQKQINVGTLLQAIRYVKGIDRYLQKRDVTFEYKFEITLVAKTIELNSSLVYLFDYFNCGLDVTEKLNISAYTYSIDINGLQFKKIEEYSLTKEGF